MNINYVETRNAYDAYIAKGGEMNHLTKLVHQHILHSGFVDSHSKQIMRSVEKITSSCDELLDHTFVAKLRYKLPPLRMGVKLGQFDQEYARLTASSLITQILIDNGFIEAEKRIEPTTIDGHKKFHTRWYLVRLGGSYEKDLLRGIEEKPGVVYQRDIKGWKLRAPEKALLRKVASIPFEVSSVCSKELLMKGYTLKTDWNRKVDKNGRPLKEDPIVRRNRYETYADTVMDEVATMPCFYLPMKYCDRDRMYYEASRLEGIRPHGKQWEVLMIDSAVSFDLTSDDEKVLKHLIYVTLHGRVSLEEAINKFSLEDLLEAQAADPFKAETEEDFGDAILLNKCYKALIDYQQGNTSKFMFGYDLTNSGLMMSGVSFKSPHMMMASNTGGSSTVHDSHTDFGKGFDVPLKRKDIKKIHMGLLHGSALKSIAKVIQQETEVECDEVMVRKFIHKAYGKSVDNITNIADWGTKIVGNEQSVLRWTMPDGFSACSRAHLKSVPILVYCASASHKEGYTSRLIVSDMPWVEDKNGYPIYSGDVQMGGMTYHVEAKKRGLFANMTHAIDAYVLRQVFEAVYSTGRPMLLKHDDYIVPPSAYFTVIETAKKAFNELFNNNLYQAACNEIAQHSPYDLEPLELVEGKAYNTVSQSANFLMP